MDDFYYRKLNVYHKAKQLVVDVYDLIKTFPKDEMYSLNNQLQRAVISIPSNIAEGIGRSSIKERIHFIEIAFGSLTETMCQLEIAESLQYMNHEQLSIFDTEIKEIARMLIGLRTNLLEKLDI